MVRTTVVVGMKLEAWIARQPGIRVVSGVDSLALAGWCARPQSARECCGLISFGVAGGLAPNLRPGTWVIGSEIVYGESRVATHKPWSKDIIRRMPGAIYGAIASVSTPIARPGAKAALHIETGAVAVDMESHIVAKVAVAHGLPMGAARVIIDPSGHALPRAAAGSLRSNGAINVAALVGATVGYPGEFSGLLRTALYALLAATALVRGRRILRSHIALTDSRQEVRFTEAALSGSPEVNTAMRKGVSP